MRKEKKIRFRFKLIILIGICPKIGLSGIIPKYYGKFENKKIRDL